jgi:ferrous iron transport protein B
VTPRISPSSPHLTQPTPLPSSPPIKIALIGSANCGKTTLFNTLTGSHYTTVNYPGATVEYAIGEGKHLPGLNATIIDTPGLASLLPVSPDEAVTVNALFSETNRPDLVVAVADVTQLSRHLYLVRQLIELRFPVMVALTMGDLLRKRGQSVEIEKLKSLLDCPVIEIDPRSARDIPNLAQALRDLHAEHGGQPRPTKADQETLAARLDDQAITSLYQTLDQIESLSLKTLPQKAKPRAVDALLLHPVLGLLIFIATMVGIFTSIFWLAAPFMDAIDGGFGWLIDMSKTHLPASWLTDLFADGLLGGIGAVLVFLPQIVILFLAMGYLEDSGYLARGAALVDRPLSAIGLNGKSFVPLLSGYACAIPAMLAARTITSPFERRLTLFIIPLMSCSARLPVYTLLLSFLLPIDQPWLGGLALTGLYLFGFVLAALVSTVISRFLRQERDGQFMLELPALRRPVVRVVLVSTWHKTWQYIRKAGPTIMVIAIGLWVLTHTPVPKAQDIGAGVGAAAEAENGEYIAVTHSYAAMIGQWIEPITKPMGLDWRGGVALISGFAAREVFVSAMALVYRVPESETDGEDGLTGKLLATLPTLKFEDTGEPIFTLSTCLGMLLFYIIALQCFPTVAVARNEMGSSKLAFIQLAFFTGLAYGLAVALVQGLRAFGIP